MNDPIWRLETLDGRQVFIRGVGTYTLESTDLPVTSTGDNFTRNFRRRVAEAHIGKSLHWMAVL